MRRDLVLVCLIAAAGFGIRTYPVWDSVFSAQGVTFLETDAAYHVRLIESQVRNYPWRITLDPYAAPGGQFVPIAPLFDTLTSTLVVMLYGRDAATGEVERIAALVPPVLGALTIIAVWDLARRLFDRRAGLIAAVLLAILPGHFMDRTLLGFVDHHALEAVLAIATLVAIVSGLSTAARAASFATGVSLGLYLLSWGSGAFFVAILGVWLALFALIARTREEAIAAARVLGIASAVALVIVALFQDPDMYRYESQVIGLVALAGIAAVVTGAARRPLRNLSSSVVVASAVVFAIVIVAGLWLLARDVAVQLLADVRRLAPDPTRMSVLEARPLFVYSGEWRWTQPWVFFRTGIVIAIVGLVPFAVRVWRQRRGGDLLLLVFTIATLAATLGQNRFGYYFVTGCAVLGGWLAMVLLDWGGVPHRDNPTPAPRTRLPLAREVAVVAVAGGMIAPNLSPRILLAERAASFPSYWRATMAWLNQHTPPPFESAGRGEEYYYARYSGTEVPSPDYTVLNWWDHGYWITQHARRVPVSNPTQVRAPNAARFYAETDPSRARAVLAGERSRYVLSDWELPFRRVTDGTIMGRFQNVIDWAGREHAPYYEVIYRRDASRWTPVWIFREPYYRSMAFRLTVLGGMGATPSNASTVITTVTRTDRSGVRFRELVRQQTYATYEAARQAASDAGAGAEVVGLDPWAAAFPLEPLPWLTQVYAARTPEQRPSEAPWVRIFRVQ